MSDGFVKQNSRVTRGEHHGKLTRRSFDGIKHGQRDVRGFACVVLWGSLRKIVDAVASTTAAAARLTLGSIFSDNVNAIAKQRLLVGIASSVAGYDEDFALFFGKATDDLDDASISGAGCAISATEQIELVRCR